MTWRVQVPLGASMTGTPSRTATVSTARWDRKEAVCEIPARGTRRALRRRLVGEGAKKPKAQCHPDQAAVYATGVWDERHASYPGRAAVLPTWARAAARRLTGTAEVSRGQYSTA